MPSEKKTQSFIVPGKPNTNHRPRGRVILEAVRPKKTSPKSGREYTALGEYQITSKLIESKDPDYEIYMQLVSKCARDAGIVMYERCHVRIEIHTPMLVTAHKTKQNVVSEPLVVPDVDNMKAIMDGLKGIAFADDKHVIHEEPLRISDVPKSDRFTLVIITETSWTDYISPEAREWCELNNVLIPEAPHE
jgi:Holliday junction resolvase RusA-like endonuclease